jgi:glycosyltransferase involved in cell wall biosynthesis
MASDKIHIIQVISGLDIGGAHGGAERFGIELSRTLDKNIFDVEICAFWRHHTEIETYWLNILKSEGIPVFFAAEWRGKFHPRGYLKAFQKLSDHCRDNGKEIIHSHFQMGTLASLYTKARKSDLALIRTAHITLEWGEGIIAWLLRQTTTNWFFPILVNVEVGVSEAILQQLVNHPGTRFSKHPPTLIHNAIHLEDFQPKTDPQSWDILIDEDDFVIGSIGRLTQQKGYEFLIKAIPAVLNAFPKTTLALIGEGELRPQLEELAKQLEVQERVIFVGKVVDVAPYLHRMDLFVLPSLWEGLPTVLLESMACGVPVIATDIPGTRELIQDKMNGWLVPPRDTEALAKSICNILDNPKQRKHIIGKTHSILGKYNITLISAKYERLFQNLLRESKLLRYR